MAVTSEISYDPNFPTFDFSYAWQKPSSYHGLSDFITILSKRGGRLVGHWTIPTSTSLETKTAVTGTRFFPYSAPCLVDHHPRHRREVLKSMILVLMEQVTALVIPLDPSFQDLGAFVEAGSFVEARHTHSFDRSFFTPYNVGSRARNRFNHAQKTTVITFHHNVHNFAFERAIVDSNKHRISLRASLAFKLAANGLITIAEARKSGVLTGQLLILHSNKKVIFMHIWFDRAHACGGTSTLLTLSGVEHCLSVLGAQEVDLEGSIIHSVDEFMDGLGAKISTYPVLYWARRREELLALVGSSLDIAGRSRNRD